MKDKNYAKSKMKDFAYGKKTPVEFFGNKERMSFETDAQLQRQIPRPRKKAKATVQEIKEKTSKK